MSTEELNKEEFLNLAISEWMHLIDRALALKEVSIAARIFPACAMFVEHAVGDFISDDGSTNSSAEVKQAFLLGKSFQEFFVKIYAWYVEKYGDVFQDKKPWAMTGFIVFSGNAFELSIPITRSDRISEKEINLHFLNCVDDTDRPLEWIKDSLKWSNFDASSNQKLIENVNFVANNVRKIRITIMTTEKPDEAADALRADIPAHLETAAEIALRGRSYGLVIWEVHQACEKMTKLVLRQSSIRYPRTHEIVDLVSLIPYAKRKQIQNLNICMAPKGKEAVAARYGEIPNLRLSKVFEIYKNGVKFLSTLAEVLEHKYPLAGKSMTLQKSDFMP